MKSNLKVLTVVGTRPEIIRLSRVMSLLDGHVNHVIAHTGQNYDYELNEIFFTDLGIRKPDHFLGAAGATAAETIGQVIIKIDPLLAEVQPEALLVLGDTNSCLAAIPAKRRQIPIFHMEAGNRCFDQRVPEEINRKIVDHIADVNMPYSAIAREHLLAELDAVPELEELDLELRLPGDFTGVKVFAPGDAMQAELKEADGLYRLSLKHVPLYSIVLLEGKSLQPI